jgi:hypothetical protein
MAVDRRPDHVFPARLWVLGGGHPAAVLQEDELKPRVCPGEAVDHQSHRFRNRRGVFPLDDLDRPLGAGGARVFFDRVSEEFSGFGEQEGVEVAADAEPRFGPLQVDGQRFACRDGDPEAAVDGEFGVEIHAVGAFEPGQFFDRFRAAARVAKSRRFPGGDFVAAGVEEIVVTGGAQVADAFRGDVVDRHCDRTVLEEGLFEPGDVVDDRPGPGPSFGDRAGQPFDVLGERFFAFEGGGEGQRGVGSEVVDDLQHRPALVIPFGRPLGENVDGKLLIRAGPGRSGQVTGEDVGVRVGRRSARDVEGVGEDADGLALAAELEGGAGVVDLQLGEALRGCRSPLTLIRGRADDRRAHGPDRADTGNGGDVRQEGGRDREGRRLSGGAGADDPRPRLSQVGERREWPTRQAGGDEDATAVADEAAGTVGWEAEVAGLGRDRLIRNRRLRQLFKNGR